MTLRELLRALLHPPPARQPHDQPRPYPFVENGETKSSTEPIDVRIRDLERRVDRLRSSS